MLSLSLALALGAAVPAEAMKPAEVYQVRAAVDGPLIAASVLAIAIPYAFARKFITPRCPCDPGEVNALDRHVIGNHNKLLDDTSDVTAGVVVAAPLVLDAIAVGFGQALLEDVTVYAETLSVNGALVTAAKYIVRRPLPRTYAGDPALINQPGGYRSFYSGHTSLVAAALSATAVTLDARYGQRVWPWVVTGAVSAMVGAERIAAGRHFYTDVAVGAVMGAAVGTLIPLWHRRAPSGESPLTFHF